MSFVSATILKSNVKYLLKGLAWGAGVLVFLYFALVLYVTLNKDSIIRSVSNEVAEKIGGNIHFKKSELSFFRTFPDISVLLTDVSVSDSMFRFHGRNLFAGKEIYCELSIPRLIRKHDPVKGFRLKKAKIDLFTNLDGYTNTYLLKRKNADEEGKKPGKSNYLEQVQFEDVSFQLSDSIKGKFFNLRAHQLFLKLKSDVQKIRGRCVMKLHVGGLTFNPFKGAYLKNKPVNAEFPFSFNRAKKELEVSGIILRIDGHPVNMSGVVNLSGDNSPFSMNVSTTNAGYDFLRSIFPGKIQQSLNIVQADGKFNAKASVGGSLKGGDPLVNVIFSTPGTSLATPFMNFSAASFAGTFTNEVVKGYPRKDPNSQISLSGFRASWHGIPVNAGVIRITDLKTPTLSCTMDSEFELAKLNGVMQSESIDWKDGRAKVHLAYAGPLVYDTSTFALLNGTVKISGGKVTYVPRMVDMDNVQAAMHFEKSDFFLDSFRSTVFGKPVNMTAEARGLMTLLNSRPDAAKLSWNIHMPELDLQPYTVLLTKKKQKARNEPKNKMATASAKIDRVLDEGQLDLNLNVGRLRFKKFYARDVRSRMTFLQDRYVIHDARLSHAGGNARLSGSLVQAGNGVHQARLVSNLQSVDVKQVFEAFENFGQEGIIADNIRGNLTADIDASLQLRESGNVVPSSATGAVKFSLKGGELINFEPVKKIQQFIFKNRDFENIRFAELKNKFEIAGPEIRINQMEIQSSVLTMFVDGVYSREGKTDLQIRLPLSNLRKRGKEFNPENLDAGAKKGSAILLRGRPGEDGNIRFKLDVFNKFRKDNKIKK